MLFRSMGKLLATVSGVLFGLGLMLSGMSRAERVWSFLDLSHGWNPSLALVMGAAVSVHVVLYRLIVRRRAPLYTKTFLIPTRRDLDPKLLTGAVIFGLGWALGGFCPGPSLLSAAAGTQSAIVFVVSMLGGMLLEKLLVSKATEATHHAVQPPSRLTSSETP